MNRLLKLILAVALAALAVTACGPQPSPVTKPGDYDRTLSSGGRERTYILHVPSGYDGSKALPLVVALHGFGDTAANMVKTVGLNSRADQDNFIVAYPNGTNEGRQAWNTGITPGLVDGVDDVGFIRALIDQLQADLKIDPKRIYAAGSSMGGFMTFRLGAELSDRLAAIGVVSGTVGAKLPDGSIVTVPTTGKPIPVIHFHGKADPTVPYDGGPGDAGAGLSWLTVADSTAFSVKQDDCTGSPQVTTSADGNIITEDYTSCAAGSEVMLVTIVNGTHEWQAAEGKAHLAASDVMWSFFAKHPRAD